MSPNPGVAVRDMYAEGLRAVLDLGRNKQSASHPEITEDPSVGRETRAAIEPAAQADDGALGLVELALAKYTSREPWFLRDRDQIDGQYDTPQLAIIMEHSGVLFDIHNAKNDA